MKVINHKKNLFYSILLLGCFTTLHSWLLQSQDEVIFHYMQKDQQKTKQNKRKGTKNQNIFVKSYFQSCWTSPGHPGFSLSWRWSPQGDWHQSVPWFSSINWQKSFILHPVVLPQLKKWSEIMSSILQVQMKIYFVDAKDGWVWRRHSGWHS